MITLIITITIIVMLVLLFAVPIYALFHAVFFNTTFRLSDMWNGKCKNDWKQRFSKKQDDQEIERSPFWHEAMKELGRLDELMGLDFIEKPVEEKLAVKKQSKQVLFNYPPYGSSTYSKNRFTGNKDTGEIDLIDQIMDDLKLLDRQGFFSVQYGIFKDKFNVGTTLEEALHSMHLRWRIPEDAVPYKCAKEIEKWRMYKPEACTHIDFHKKIEDPKFTCVVCGKTDKNAHTHELERNAKSLTELSAQLAGASDQLQKDYEKIKQKLGRGRTGSAGPRFQGIEMKRMWS